MIKKVRRIFKMHRIFITQHLKQLMEYKIDFLTGAVSFIIDQGAQILFLWIIFSQIPDLAGWKFEEIVFIYGFSLIPKGIDHLFFDNLWSVGYFIVQKGDFDKYLTRPIHPLFHVIVEKFQLDALGEIIVGVVLLASSITQVGISWNLLNILLFAGAIFFATFIYTGIKTATSAVALWTKRSGNVIHMFYMVNDFAKYPTNIYNDAIRNMITFIIPFAFTAFYPASYFLTGENPLFNIGGTIIASVAVMAIGILLWNKGIDIYESAGS